MQLVDPPQPLPLTPEGGKEGPKYQSDRLRGAHQWERAARSYLDGLEQDSDNPAIWIELGRALKEAGKDFEAQFAHRMSAGTRRMIPHPVRRKVRCRMEAGLGDRHRRLPPMAAETDMLVRRMDQNCGKGSEHIRGETPARGGSARNLRSL